MSKIDNGGEAFPACNEANVNGTMGMSLRDYFAGQALSQASRDIWAQHKYEDVAKRAYGIADAMIAARTKGSDHE